MFDSYIAISLFKEHRTNLQINSESTCYCFPPTESDPGFNKVLPCVNMAVVEQKVPLVGVVLQVKVMETTV